MENGNKPISEKPHLSVSLCGQLGVKKNFLQRAFGKDWNTDKAKRYDNERDVSSILKEVLPKTQIKEMKESDKTFEPSEVFIQSTSPHQSYTNSMTSVGPLIPMDNSDSDKQNCHSIPNTTKEVVASPLVIDRDRNKSDGTKRKECPELQCQPLTSRSNVLYASRNILTPQKNLTNEMSIEKTSYPITPQTKCLGNDSHSENKRADSSIVPSGFSVKRRIFSHDDKENRPPLSTQDMIPNRRDEKETKSSFLSKLNSMTPKAQTKQMQFPAIHTAESDAYCRGLPKQNFSTNVKQLTSQPFSSSQMSSSVSVPFPPPSSSHCIRIRSPEDDKMKDSTKPELGE